VEPENKKVWLQTQHGGNGERKIDVVVKIKRKQGKTKNLYGKKLLMFQIKVNIV